VGADRGAFDDGDDATYLGSMGNTALNEPIVGLEHPGAAPA
jgi:hypothetical protein